jgi:hypothetical protein
LTYSETDDLLLGDIILGAGLDPQKFVDQAAEDIDAKLGWVYELPLKVLVPEGAPRPADPDDYTKLPLHEQLLLKGINNKLASGRLILAEAVAGEDNSLNAYGYFLVKEATDELTYLANGEVPLSAVRYVTVEGDVVDKVPTIKNQDEESLLLGFENTVMRGEPWWSRPGQVT